MLQNVPDVAVAELSARLQHPTSRGLALAVSRAIADGAVAPGDRLPPIRTLATALGLSPTTVSASWALLARSGAIRTDGRRGSTITDQRPSAVRYRRALQGPATFALDLSSGIPDPALLPDLHHALRRVPTDATLSSYLDDPVVPELIDVLRRDWPYAAESFTVVDGALDAMELVARTFLGFGDRVVVEQPTFPPVIDLLEAAGVEVIGVPVDAHGMSAAGLAAALVNGVSAIFIQPRGQNPTGVSLSAGRRAELAALLRGTATIIVEDDSSGAVATNPIVSFGSVLPEQTVHIRSFSKSHGPDLRLAAVTGPAQLIERLTALRQLGQGWTSRLLQRLLLALLTDPRAIEQVASARAEYARRRSAMVAALGREGIAVGGDDGINVWVPVQDEAAATVRLASLGIGVAPGAPFAVRADQPGHVRVTAGLLAERHDEFAAALAAAARATGWSGAR
jgi:DNA-binding transcriptional MocR family regulator